MAMATEFRMCTYVIFEGLFFSAVDVQSYRDGTHECLPTPDGNLKVEIHRIM